MSDEKLLDVSVTPNVLGTFEYKVYSVWYWQEAR